MVERLVAIRRAGCKRRHFGFRAANRVNFNNQHEGVRLTVADKDRTIISILEKVFSNEIINIKVFASISPICHYTNFDALHNIISNKEFYLSPISSMTDTSEFDWSINIIDRCVSGGLDSNLNGVIKSALELATEAKEETYVSC